MDCVMLFRGVSDYVRRLRNGQCLPQDTWEQTEIWFLRIKGKGYRLFGSG